MSETAENKPTERYEVDELFTDEDPDTRQVLQLGGAIIVAGLVVIALIFSTVKGGDYLSQIFGSASDETVAESDGEAAN